ncbi:MAG: CocE/NonD family hydrolase, partial [Bacteroidales bacterium]
FFILINYSAQSQTITGDWHGMLSIQGITLRISVHVFKSNEGYSSTWDSPDQNAMGIPSTTTTFVYPEFSFTHSGAGFKYNGKVSPDYSEIEGTLSQGGQKHSLTFTRKQVMPAPGSQAYLKEKYTKQEVYITMRDDVKLFTSIYIPNNKSVQHPILINRTPYNIEPRGPESFNFFLQVYSRYVEAEYIMVFQDVRGKYMSEGIFEDIRPVKAVKTSDKDTDETTDTWDTVDWLVKNVPGNNGRVGIFGISYPGFYSTMGAINAHPAVKAVSPQAPVTAWFIGDDFHHNGAFFLLDCFSFFYSNGHQHRSPSRRGFPSFRWPISDNYEFFMSEGAVKNISQKYFGDSVKFWNDAFAHPDYDDFWKARDPRQHMKNITPAIMTVGGWFDAEDLYGAIHTYKAFEEQNPPELENIFVMGPWSHGQWAFGKGENIGNVYWGMDANEKYISLEKEFFDYYLLGQGDGKFAEATIYITGSNTWKEFNKWPPENVEEKKLYLHQGGKLSFTPPSVKRSYDEYVSDPMKPVPYTEDVHTSRTAEYMVDDQRFASRRPDVMVYQTDILTEDITFTGPLVADLFVSITGTDADYVVKLIDVFPPDTKAPEDKDIKVPLGGYQMLVRGEVFRGRYRNSFEHPEPFTPGKVTEVKYELPDVSHTFKKGHKIMIQIQNSWFPLVDRNPQKFVNIYKCSEEDFQKATHRIYHDSKYPTNLKVMVLME